MSNLELLNRAAKAATCQMLESSGYNLVGAGAVSLWFYGTGFVPMTAGAVSLMAAEYLCNDMLLGGTPPDSGIDGCQQISEGGYGQLELTEDGENWGSLDAGGYGDKATSIVSTEVGDPEQGRGYPVFVTFDALPDATNYTWTAGFYESQEAAQRVKFRIAPTVGTCDKESNGTNPIPPEALQPIQYTDNVTNCNYTVTLQGFAQQSQGGAVDPVYLIEAGEQTRSDGGRMGGCNFPPTIYTPGGGGGGTYLPVPDGGGGGLDPDGLPWWAKPLLAAVAGAALNQIADLIKDMAAPVYENSSFTLTTPCDKTENGDPVSYFFPFPPARFEQRVIDHQMAILQTLQYHLNSKTPTCSSSRPPLEGEWITTRWQSDEVMDHSGRRLRKLFRYRSKSSRELQQLSSYWESFVWRSGPVCVTHKGAWWGNPQVWAESAEEGKRVIRFAGAEAGLDPDQTGRWEISGSRTPRYGMPGTMRILQHKGFPWVASRDGADWPNVLAKEA